MQVLNLDDLAKPTGRTIVLNGESHKVEEMSVEGFIQFTRMSREIDEKTKADRLAGKETMVEDGVNMSVATLKVALPSVSEEKLRALNLVQLMTLIKFINGELDSAQSAGAAQGEGEPEKKS